MNRHTVTAPDWCFPDLRKMWGKGTRVLNMDHRLQNWAKFKVLMTTILERHFDVHTLHDRPVVQAEKLSPKPVQPIDKIVQTWMTEFNAAMTARDSDAIAALFHENGISKPFFLSCKDGSVMFWPCLGNSTLMNPRNRSET
jgi:hypothetical protein